MPDSPAGGAAFLSGQEIVNDGRTLAYLAAGYGPLNMQILGGCACPRIRELIECDSDPYVSPAADPAPWYDASVPESADFAGFLTTEFEGLGSTYTRSSTEKVTGGSVLGRLRPQARTLTWRGYLFGRSDCAVRYGLSWMTANLRGPNCSCTGEELDLMVCCPELTESPPVSGCDSLPEIQRPEPCSPYTQPDAFRTLKNVGLLSGPTILSQRKIGCKASCGSDTCGGDSLIMEVEFSILAGNPFLHGCPTCLCVDQPFPVAIPADGDCEWIKVEDSNNPPDTCGGDVCPPPFDCTDDELAVCQRADLPEIPEFVDSCFCDPIAPVQFCCSVPAESFGQFFEGAPLIEIYSGSSPMRSTTIRFFENLVAQDCCDASGNPCVNCDSLQISFIPAYSTMTIDGSTRSVTVQCRGQVEPVRAEHLTVTPFAWPILKCIDYCICIETDGVAVAADATVSVSVVPREM